MADNDRVLERYLGQIDSVRTQNLCRERVHWLCRQVRGQRVLDIGCSQGICPVILGREGRDVLGIDIEEETIRVARELLAGEPAQVRSRVTFTVGDAFRMELPHAAFDTVVLGEILEHLANPDELLGRVAEWLVDGGQIVVSVPLGFHPYHDHKRTFYLSNLLDLLGEHFAMEAVDVIEHRYLCAVAAKRTAGAPVAPAPETLRQWNRLVERAQEYAERDMYDRGRANLTALQEARAALKTARATARAQAARERGLAAALAALKADDAKLKAALAESRSAESHWQASARELQATEDSLRNEIRRVAAELSTANAKLRAIRQARERERSVRGRLEARVRRCNAHIQFYTAELERRQHEIRYLLGDALVKAARPSKDTLLLPFRLARLFAQGLRRQFVRRHALAPMEDTGAVLPADANPDVVHPSLGSAGPSAAVPGVAASPRGAPESRAVPHGNGSRDAGEADCAPGEIARASLPACVVDPRNGNPLVLADPAGRNAAPARRTSARAALRAAVPAPTRGFLFFCVNGAGLGHLTRALSVARRIRRLAPEMPIYFLTSSQALGAISREGLIAYHIPVRSGFGDLLTDAGWNQLLIENFRAITGAHRPAILVYDGVSPYSGLMKVVGDGAFRHTAMVLRLRHKHGRVGQLTDRLGRFDELIFPGEAGVDVPAEFVALPHRVVDPIIYLDRDELLPREEARRHWDIAPDKKAVYIQLGAGNINDTAPWIERVLTVLQARPDVEVVLAESPIAERADEARPGLHLLRHYPNSLYFYAFDLAITAAGYNTYHELMHFGVPSVLIPNQETVTDDQVARARTAADAGAARVVLTMAELEPALTATLDDTTARDMRANALALVPRNGALDVARELLEIAHAYDPAALTERTTPAGVGGPS